MSKLPKPSKTIINTKPTLDDSKDVKNGVTMAQKTISRPKTTPNLTAEETTAAAATLKTHPVEVIRLAASGLKTQIDGVHDKQAAYTYNTRNDVTDKIMHIFARLRGLEGETHVVRSIRY